MCPCQRCHQTCIKLLHFVLGQAPQIKYLKFLIKTFIKCTHKLVLETVGKPKMGSTMLYVFLPIRFSFMATIIRE